MSRRNKDKGRLPDFVPLIKSTLKTPAWRAMSHGARSLYVSTFHLCRLFKHETGMPIHHYLNRLRLRAALEPVVGGTGDLGELAVILQQAKADAGVPQ